MFHVKHFAIICNYQLFTIVSRFPLSVVFCCQLFIIVIIRIYPLSLYYFVILAVLLSKREKLIIHFKFPPAAAFTFTIKNLSRDLLPISKADIRNPLRYLLMNAVASRSVNGSFQLNVINLSLGTLITK